MSLGGRLASVAHTGQNNGNTGSLTTAMPPLQHGHLDDIVCGRCLVKRVCGRCLVAALRSLFPVAPLARSFLLRAEGEILGAAFVCIEELRRTVDVAEDEILVLAVLAPIDDHS